MIVVLDASALMAVILNEPGYEEVLAVDRGSEISIVNVAEVMSTVCERGGASADVEQAIQDLGLRIRAFRDAHAQEVARLRPLTKRYGLGLGDRACLAQGMLSERPVLTGDHDWAKLDLGVDVRFFRPQRT